MSIFELRKNAKIAANTMTCMRKYQNVYLDVLGHICDCLECDFGDIVEYKPNKNMDKSDENISD